MVRELNPVELFLSGRADADYSLLGCPVLTDEFADAGPLAGIAVGLQAASAPLVLVLAVDMPDLTSAMLHLLRRQCASGVGDHGEQDVRETLRRGKSDESLCAVLEAPLRRKQLEHSCRDHFTPCRPMTTVGG